MIKKHYWLIAIMVLMIFGSCSLRDQIVQPYNDSITYNDSILQSVMQDLIKALDSTQLDSLDTVHSPKELVLRMATELKKTSEKK